MKKFKELREALDKKNPEAAALKPRAKGEQDFANMHTKTDKEYPVAGTDATLNARSMGVKDHHPQNGDRAVVQQGTSKLADRSGFKGSKTPLTRADQTQGDLKPVRGPSSVRAESIFDNITDLDEGVSIELSNGDIVELDVDQIDSIQEVFAQLSTANQEIFKSQITESLESFDAIFQFVQNNK
jgi:hypothetical protein